MSHRLDPTRVGQTPDRSSAMFLLEVPLPRYYRRFIVDCPHATTVMDVPNFAKPDPARAEPIWDALIKQSRERAKKDDGEDCRCVVMGAAPLAN